MIIKRIILNKVPTNYLNLFNQIANSFSDRDFKQVGKSKKHYHIVSKSRSDKGILELTIGKANINELTLKIAANRDGKWVRVAFNKMEEYLLNWERRSSRRSS